MSASSIGEQWRSMWRHGLRPRSAAALTFAAICIAAATAARLALGLIGPDIVPFATYYPAVLVVTLVAGVWTGVLAMLLGAIVSWFLFLPPQYTFLPLAAHDAVSLVVYLIVSSVIVWIVEMFRRARFQLSESVEASAELNAVITYSADAIIGFGLDGTIQSWNAGAERIFGYRADEIVGRPIQTLVPPDRLHEPQKYFPRTRAGEMLQFETVRMGKGGQRIDVSVSTGPIRSQSGRIVGVSAIFHDITARKRREEHIQFVMREMTHRAKNLLAVVQAIARQTGRQAVNQQDFQLRFTARIQSLAQSHDILVKREWRGCGLDDLVAGQLAPFAEISSRVVTEGPDVVLSPQAAEQIGIALHELATNAVKHGALSVPGGKVNVSWNVEPNGDSEHLKIVWRERGGPAVSAPANEGFGHLVVRKLVPTQLEGRASLEFPPEGLSWTLELPAKTAMIGRVPL